MRAHKVSDLGVDMLTLVGHKFGAPKGVAALFVRRGVSLPPMIRGGGQEAGRRGGTENVLLISGMGKAAEVGRTRGFLLAAYVPYLFIVRYIWQSMMVMVVLNGEVATEYS